MTGAKLRVGYLAGSGHTGSTLIALLMDTHPDIASVGETAFTPKRQRRGDAGQVCSCGKDYFSCEFWQSVFSRAASDGVELSPHRWSNDYRYANQTLHRLLTRYSSNPSVRRLQDLAAITLPLHRARIRSVNRANVSFIRAVLETAGAHVFFDSSKRPYRLRHLLSIPELDVRVVKLFRDVRGYASSAKRRGHDITEAAQAWRNDRVVIDEVTDALPRESVMDLRYEDLCADTSGTLRLIHQFLGVEPQNAPTEIVPSQHHVLGNRIRLQETLQVRLNDRWRGDLSVDEVSRILAIAGDVNRNLGYV